MLFFPAGKPTSQTLVDAVSKKASVAGIFLCIKVLCVCVFFFLKAVCTAKMGSPSLCGVLQVTEVPSGSIEGQQGTKHRKICYFFKHWLSFLEEVEES